MSSKDKTNKPKEGKVKAPKPTPEPISELSETPVIDGEQVDAPPPKEEMPTPESIVGTAATELTRNRNAIQRNLEALAKIEEAIEVCVREQVDLHQDIQLSALVGISAGTVIKVDKANLDCVLLGQAKGQFIKRDGDIVLVIHKRMRVVEKEN
jgi:hypothetical protein